MSFHIPAHKSGTAGQVIAALDDLPKGPLDFQRVRYTNVTLLFPRTERAREFCDSCVLLDDAARSGSAYVVENSIIDSLWADIIDSDFLVR
jgi:hypothetical protein